MATARGSAGMSTARNRRCFAASLPRGETKTCWNWPQRFAPDCFLPTCEPGPGPLSSRPTVTRSATAIGFLCTTDMSRDIERLRRELLLAVHPELFSNIAGSTDSELLFHLALTFGLTDDPITGIARMAGFVEAIAHAAGVAEPALQMTVGVSDGVRLYAVRYASGPEVNTLFVSEHPASVRMLYPDDEGLEHFGDDARVVVSEPLTQLPGMWREVPPGSALIIGKYIEERGFQPISPTAA